MIHKTPLQVLLPTMQNTRGRHLLPMRGFAAGVLVIFIAFNAVATSTSARGEGRLPAPLAGNARPVIEQFLMNQTAGLPGKVGITINTPMSGPLPACEQLDPFLPNGARLWGRVSVGVRCLSGQPWTRYVPAYIALVGNYHVAARSISTGQVLVLADISVREGDLTALPAGVVADPSQLLGMTASNAIAAGSPIRRELLRGAIEVQQGQSLKVISRGTGFMVSTEGKAVKDAALGAVIQVKMQGGQLLSGTVRPNGIVERLP